MRRPIRTLALSLLAISCATAHAQRSRDENRALREAREQAKLAEEMARLGEPVKFAEPLLGLSLAPGTVLDLEYDPFAEVWSGWLSNGIRLHVRVMPERPGAFDTIVLLAGSNLLESEEQRGLSQAAAQMLGRPATLDLSADALMERINPRSVRLGCTAGRDALSLRVRGNVHEMATGFELAHAVLTEPGEQPDMLRNWIEIEATRAERQRATPSGLLVPITWTTIGASAYTPLAPLSPEQMRAISSEDAREWILAHGCSAPASVAIVGGFNPAQVIELAAKYFGSLPPRPRIAADTYASLRTLPTVNAPLDHTLEIESEATEAAIALGWIGADGTNPDLAQRLQIGAMVLRIALEQALVKDGGMARAAVAQFFPNADFEHAGTCLTAALVDPEQAETALIGLAEAIDAAAGGNLDAEAFEKARLAAIENASRLALEMTHWSEHLAESTYRGQSIREPLRAAEGYASLTPAECLDAINALRAGGRLFRVIVRSAPKPAKDDAASPES